MPNKGENNIKYNGAICGKKTSFQSSFFGCVLKGKIQQINNANILKGLFIDTGMLIINNHFV